MDPQVGSVLVLLYPLAIGYATVRYRLFDATVVIRRSVVYTMLAGLITGAYALLLAGANALAGPGGLDALAVVLGGVHVRRGAPVQPAPRMGAAGGRSHLLPRALRLRADHPGAGPLHGEPARPRRDHAPAHRRPSSRPCTSARRGSCWAGCLPTSSPSSRSAPGALSRYQLAADPRFAGDSAPALAAYAGARRRGRRAAPIPGRARGAPGAGPEALGGGLYRRRPRAARDGGRPGGGGGRQRRGAPARARLRPGAGAEPADPHQPRQVRPAARAPAHRGVAGGARRSTSARPT